MFKRLFLKASARSLVDFAAYLEADDCEYLNCLSDLSQLFGSLLSHVELGPHSAALSEIDELKTKQVGLLAMLSKRQARELLTAAQKSGYSLKREKGLRSPSFQSMLFYSNYLQTIANIENTVPTNAISSLTAMRDALTTLAHSPWGELHLRYMRVLQITFEGREFALLNRKSSTMDLFRHAH